MLKKALGILAHPLSFGAIGLYAVNTFVFQRLWPSWWTGKLGDFAWLFFFPYVLTAIFAFMLPRKWRERSFLLAVAVVGIAFVLVKTTLFNQYIVHLLTLILRVPVSLSKDATDVISLAALAGTVLFWMKYQPSSVPSRKIGLLLIPVSVLFTLADSAMPDYGLTYLERSNGAIVTCSTHATYQSFDGGMTWEESSQDYGWECPYHEQENAVVLVPHSSLIQYRYQPGVIERSSDGGQTWKIDYDWRLPTQADQIYFQMYHHYSYSNSPLFALGDPQTGNILFAMGIEGILVRNDNEMPLYSWISVGEYQKNQFDRSGIFPDLIGGEITLGFLAGGLGVTLLRLRLKKSRRIDWIFISIILVGWALVVVVFPPALLLSSNYDAVLPAMGILCIGILTLPATIYSFIQIWKTSRSFLGRFLLVLVIIPLLFIFPYILWLFNILTNYYHALAIGLSLIIVTAIYLWVVVPKWSLGKLPADAQSLKTVEEKKT